MAKKSNSLYQLFLNVLKIISSRGLFLSFILLPVIGFSQGPITDFPDMVIEPDPFKDLVYRDYNSYTNISSVATIFRRRKDHFISDTFEIHYYNNKGLKTKAIRYKKNAPSTTRILTYNDIGKLIKNQSIDHKSRKDTSTVLYTFDDQHQLVTVDHFTIKQINGENDTLYQPQKTFAYNNAKLIEFRSGVWGMQSISKYKYVKGRLITKTGGFTSKKFGYDKKGNLTSMYEYTGGEIDEKKLMGIKKFKYDRKNRLIIDSILTGSNMPAGKWQITEYLYTNNDTLKTMRVTFGSHYRNVQFKYLQGKIKDIIVDTNVGTSAYLRFWINHHIDTYYTFPINYREVYAYDNFGNKVSKKMYVNGELFDEVEFQILYK